MPPGAAQSGASDAAPARATEPEGGAALLGATQDRNRSQVTSNSSKAVGRAREVLQAVRLTSSASLLTVVFGIISNKIVAHVSGSHGIALLGTYRILASLASTIGLFGITDVVTRRLARAKQPDQAAEIITASVQFAVPPIVVNVVIAVLCARPIAVAMFGPIGLDHVGEVRIALALSCAAIGFSLVQAILNGQRALREITLCTIGLSGTTLIVSYPFLSLGGTGLALIVSAGPFVATAIGAYFIVRRNQLRAADFKLRTVSAVNAIIPVSLFLVVHPFVSAASGLIHQSVMARGYGLDSLGLYNAGTTLEATAIAMLTAPMRSYFLPTLGRIEDHRERRRFAERMLFLLLSLTLVGGSVLVLGAPELLHLLFAKNFSMAAPVVGVLTLSFVGQIFVWICGMQLIHDARFGTWVVIDIIWAALRIGGTYACIRHDAPVVAAAAAHAGAFTVQAVIYVFATRERGLTLITARALVYSVAVLGLLSIAMWLASSRAVLPIIVYAATATAFAAFLLRRMQLAKTPSLEP
jgi:O-antigen/teichoic acid export membrane protein